MTDTPPIVFSQDSIFDVTKKMLNIDIDDPAFDVDLIIHINSALMVLTQLGVGPSEGFMITGRESKWSDLVGNSMKIEAVKVYVFLKVRVLFDPPANSTVLESFNRSIAEMEWRLNANADPGLNPDI